MSWYAAALAAPLEKTITSYPVAVNQNSVVELSREIAQQEFLLTAGKLVGISKSVRSAKVSIIGDDLSAVIRLESNDLSLDEQKALLNFLCDYIEWRRKGFDSKLSLMLVSAATAKRRAQEDRFIKALVDRFSVNVLQQIRIIGEHDFLYPRRKNSGQIYMIESGEVGLVLRETQLINDCLTWEVVDLSGADPHNEEAFAEALETASAELKDKSEQRGYILLVWRRMSEILKQQFGIHWRSPDELNPDQVID